MRLPLPLPLAAACLLAVSATGCSRATEEPSTSDTCAAAVRDFEHVATEAQAAGQKLNQPTLRVLARIITNNPKCFSASEVANAQEFLEAPTPTNGVRF